MRLGVLLVMFLMIPASRASGEGTPFLWTPPHRQTANVISWGTAIGGVGVDTWRSFHAPDRKTAFLSQGCALGVAGVAMRTTKHFVHRDRPDGSDNMSMPSGHTTYAFTGVRQPFDGAFAVSLSAGVATAYFRQAAGKHYLSDTLAGAGAGIGSTALCDWLTGR